jgi:hypothetical protein
VLINQGFNVFGHERLVSYSVDAAKHPRPGGVTIRGDDATMGVSGLYGPRPKSRSRAGRDADVAYRPSLFSGAAHEVLRQPEVAR